MDRIEIVGVLGKLSAFDFCTCSFLFDGIFMFQALQGKCFQQKWPEISNVQML